MGEVWLARDTRLNRQVALKVSKEAFSDRFQQEAKAIAALNHPNVCTLYDVGPDYLVMEYVEGKRPEGPLPLAEVLAMGAGLCDALAAAHRHGITHRDLKPANILLTAQGPKLLDFGLARQRAPESLDETQPITTPGTIVGTLQYMAPEQLRGQEADARSDLFSLGVVLYELLTGRRAFASDSQAGLIAAILKEAPALLYAAGGAPTAVEKRWQRVLERCLEKDPNRRWQSAQDLAAELRWLSAELGEPQVTEVTRRRPNWLAMAAYGLMMASSIFILLRGSFGPAPEAAPLRQWSIPNPPNEDPRFRAQPFISPDGAYIALVSTPTNGLLTQVWVYDTRRGEMREVPDSAGLEIESWSTDSTRLVLSQEQAFRIWNVERQQMSDFPVRALGLVLYKDHHIYCTERGIFRGDSTNAVGKLIAASTSTSYLMPLLPDGKGLLAIGTGSISRAFESIALLNGESGGQKVLSGVASTAVFAAPNHLLYSEANTLYARPFDPTTGEFRGAAMELMPGVPMSSLRPNAPSANQVLALRTFAGKAPRGLFLVDRRGNVLQVLDRNHLHANPEISPDGNWVATATVEAASGSKRQIRILNLRSGSEVTPRLPEVDHTNPTWSPDGRQLYFSSLQQGKRSIFRTAFPAAGPPEPVYREANRAYVEQIARDGKQLLFNTFGDKERVGIAALDLATPGAGARMVLQEDADILQARLSPDGKWIAYSSMLEGTIDIFVQSYPPNGKRWRISRGGGYQPQWRADGKELYFNTSKEIQAVSIAVEGSELLPGPVQSLFRARLDYRRRGSFAALPDGQSFVIPADSEPPLGPVRVIENWPRLLPGR